MLQGFVCLIVCFHSPSVSLSCTHFQLPKLYTRLKFGRFVLKVQHNLGARSKQTLAVILFQIFF